MLYEDDFCQWFNPGQLGLKSRLNNISLTYNLPLEFQLYSANTYSTFGMSVGYNFSNELGIPLSVGLGYIRQNMDIAEYVETDITWQVLGKYKSSESANALTVSAGIDYWFKLGMGFTYKHISSELNELISKKLREGTANVMDFGMLISAPIIRDLKFSELTLFNTNFNVGYSISNLFDNMNYNDKIDDPLPRYEQFGYSISINLHQIYKDVDYELLSIDWAAQADNLLMKRDSANFEYLPIFSRINIWENIIKLNSTYNLMTNYGIRISIAETIKILYGVRTQNNNDYANTFGVIISSRGTVKYLNSNSESEFLRYFVEHIELLLIYSNYKINRQNVPNLTRNFFGLNLIFKNFNL